MYLFVILFPAMGAIAAGLFGKALGRYGSSIVSSLSVFSSFLLSCFIAYEVILSNSPCHIKLFTWIYSENFEVSWGFLFDSLTAMMLIVVTSISTLVHLYSTEYMEADPHRSRFMAYLSLFTFCMLMLVTADNFIQMFLGWEGVGVSSYLLINFWFTRIQANKSAMKAMIVNKFGDTGLILGIVFIFFIFKSTKFNVVFANAVYYLNTYVHIWDYEINTLNLICVLLFIGSIGKSAQLGLHTWLPDAMEGPTPVSALIHAATMVTAGVFLVLRCSPLFEYAPEALTMVTFFGALTAFFAATCGLVQNDLKRVIAYSTCSQLGYMIFACGLSNYSVSAFHLTNHAFFKALLFLGAGAVIHAMLDEQDMRRMGGLVWTLPITYSLMLTASLSLMGFPFLTGFYSKDVILETSYATFMIEGSFSHWLGCFSAMLTAFYSTRLIYLTFLNQTSALKKFTIHLHEAEKFTLLALSVLGVLSIFAGYFLRDLFIGAGTLFWGNALYTVPFRISILDAEFIPVYIKLIPVLLSLSGVGLAYVIYHHFSYKLSLFKLQSVGYSAYNYLISKWYFDKIYNYYFVWTTMSLGYNVTFIILDKGLIEIFGPYGLSKSVYKLSSQLSKTQTGLVYHYMFMMILGLAWFLSAIGLSWMLSTNGLPLTPLIIFFSIFIYFNVDFFKKRTSNNIATVKPIHTFYHNK
jgi:NADH-ubiquinone oxidoreductase chain 5